MDLGIGIAMAASAFSASGVIFTILTFKQTTGKNSLEAVEVEMKAFQNALVECRVEVARLRADNERFRSENERLMRRVLNLERPEHG